MAAEGSPFRGVLYVGLMLAPGGIRVLEYNVRLGDPEAQPVLFRLENDLVEVLQAIHRQTLDSVRLRWDSDCSVCVVMASGGYPGKYPTGRPIQGVDDAEAVGQVKVFHAGTRLQDGQLVTAGGRVLGVTARDADLPSAVARVYRALREGAVRADAFSERYREAGVELAGCPRQSSAVPNFLVLNISFWINLGGCNYGTGRRHHHGE